MLSVIRTTSWLIRSLLLMQTDKLHELVCKVLEMFLSWNCPQCSVGCCGDLAARCVDELSLATAQQLVSLHAGSRGCIISH